jgi:hypothetical protein
VSFKDNNENQNQFVSKDESKTAHDEAAAGSPKKPGNEKEKKKKEKKKSTDQAQVKSKCGCIIS